MINDLNKKMKNKYIILFLSMFLSISLVNAISIDTPSQVNIKENFNLIISGYGFYALEIHIPQEFQIVSDPSGGMRTNDLYKTVTTGSLTIVLRGTKTGTFTISGQYTTGEGIKDLNSEIIQVNQLYTPALSCPTCPSATVWSNCEKNRQIRIIYSCSASTNYQCIESAETQSCQIEIQSSPITCNAEWICKDSTSLAYQSSDCSLSSVQKCNYGCENKKCKVSNLNIKEIGDNLTVTINPPEEIQKPSRRNLKSIFDKIIDFIKKIIDALIFWSELPLPKS